MATITGTFNSLVSGTLSGVIGTPGPQGIPGAQGQQGPAGPAPVWGAITGTLSAQTDLSTALAGKYSTTNPAGYIDLTTAGLYFYPLTGNPNSFATQAWVIGQNYLTASSLDSYATQSWVNYQLAGYALQSWVTDRFYDINNPDGFIGDAPSDGSQYARKNGAWDIVSGGGSYITSVTSPLAVISGELSINLSSYLTTSAAASTYAVTARGLPASGTVGQVLTKQSGTAYDSAWATLIPGDRYLTTSTTSNAISNGNKTFTIGTGLSYTPTQNITISYDATHHMHGEVLTYNSGTGVLTVDINNHAGTGTYASWVINVGGVTPATSVAWGDITGTLGSQTDLATALNNKLEVSTAASTYYLQTNPDGFIGDAPSDGSQYARQDGAWEVVSGGGGGIPDAPSDNYLYGRINGIWYRVPGFTPFSQIATHFSSVAGWAVYGGNVYLSPSGVVAVDTASAVTGIAIYLGDTSTSTIDLSPLSGMTGQISLNTLTSMTATPTLPSGGFNNLYVNNCAFNSLPALDSYTALTVLTVYSCPNLTSIPNVSSYFSGQIDINNCPITSIPSIGLATYVSFQYTAITSGPYLGSNDSLNYGQVSGNALMVTAPSFYGANVLGTAYVNGNVSMTGAPSFYYCAMMATVEVSNNAVMASFPDLTGCTNLGYVNISNNASMSASPSIPFSANLYHVNLSNNPLMSSTPSLGGFPVLTHINLSGCNIDASSLDGFGSSMYSNASTFGIYSGYLNISGGTNGAFDSTSLPSWIGDLQSYYSWTIVYNSY